MPLREELQWQGRWLFRWRSYLPLLLIPLLIVALRHSEFMEQSAGEGADTIWEVICVAISFMGLVVRGVTIGYVPKGTSGRNRGSQKAEVLNTTGMYSVVRHPLYLGNFLVFFGLTLFVEVWWFPVIAVLAFWLYYERIIFAEEEFLRAKFGDEFLEWASKTPAFIPKIRPWKAPALSFSLKKAVRKENNTFFAIIAFYTFMELVGGVFSEGKLEVDLAWSVIFIISLTIYLTIRVLRKTTKIFEVEGG